MHALFGHREFFHPHIIRAEKYGPVIDQPGRALLGDPRFVRHELFRVRPHRHTSCADEDSIPLLQRGALFGQCPLEVRGGNFVGVGQQRHPFLGGHVNENPASDDGRDFISAGFGPPLVPEILRRLITVKNLVPVAQMVEAIHVRAAMRGHQHRVIIESEVLRAASRREFFDLDPAGRVRHPHVVRWIAHA